MYLLFVYFSIFLVCINHKYVLLGYWWTISYVCNSFIKSICKIGTHALELFLRIFYCLKLSRKMSLIFLLNIFNSNLLSSPSVKSLVRIMDPLNADTRNWKYHSYFSVFRTQLGLFKWIYTLTYFSHSMFYYLT